MGIRELTRQLKRKTVQEWMEENGKKPFGYNSGAWFSEEWRGVGGNDYDILDRRIFEKLPQHTSCSPGINSITYLNKQEAIAALEIALRRAGEIE